MNWEIIIPIIVALVSSGLSYLAAVRRAKIDMEKELKLQEVKHRQELERLEKEMEIKNKTKENDAMFGVMTQFMSDVIKDPDKIDDLIELSERVKKYNE